MTRPAIPSDLRRRVLVEAGHRCAIPTCRYIDVEVHHIVPWAKAKRHSYDNLIALCPNCHARAGKGDIDRKSLRLYKANLRFAHDKYSQVEMDVLFDLYHKPKNQGGMWPPFNNILLLRIIESGFIEIHKPKGSISIGGMQASPNVITITDEGRAFIDSLGVKKL